MATMNRHHDVKWHPGEIAIHRLLNGAQYSQPNPTSAGLPPSYAYRVAASPLVAFGALDGQGRPWTTIWGGKRQFTRAVAPNVLGVQSLVDLDYDPVIDALFGHNGDAQSIKGDGELLRPGPDSGPVMAALSIDLETRDRVKLAGRMIAGAAAAQPTPDDAAGTGVGHVGEVQLAMFVQETLGNCPKYLNKKAIRPHVPRPRLVYSSDATATTLPQPALDLIHRADLFFLSSTDGQTMDTNHRGGPPGFLRVADNGDASRNDDVDEQRGKLPSTITLVYPEFSGNRLYQTLGNLQVKPLVGMAIPDFETGDVLYLTGHTKTLVGDEAAAYLPHTKLAIRITVDSAVLVADGLPFRGSVIDYSPYNPPVRPLISEMEAAGAATAKKQPIATALLAGRETLTPSISRFTFTLSPPSSSSASEISWQAGQYMTLDFAPELDVGWSHMRDDDPQSLNDDFIRTFTISSPPSARLHGTEKNATISVEMTLRRHGPATNLLWSHNLRVPLEIPVLGFGGDEKFRLAVPGAAGAQSLTEEAVFVAAGVGITPLVAQAPGLLSADNGKEAPRLKVLWSLRAEDAPLAVDSFARVSGLARHTTLFITGMRGAAARGADHREVVRQVREMGATVIEGRRIQKTDLVPETPVSVQLGKRKIYICTGPTLLQAVQAWLPDENLVWESFAY